LIHNKYFVDGFTTQAWVKPLIGGSRRVLWKGVDTALIEQ
jgi:hypothetical protein